MYGYTLSTDKLPLYYLVEQDLLGAPLSRTGTLSRFRILAYATSTMIEIPPLRRLQRLVRLRTW